MPLPHARTFITRLHAEPAFAAQFSTLTEPVALAAAATAAGYPCTAAELATARAGQAQSAPAGELTDQQLIQVAGGYPVNLPPSGGGDAAGWHGIIT